MQNRKLLVSVFDAQEAREAVIGGGRIIDSEDPRSALGNIKPRHIMEVSDAVLEFRRDLDIQLSTNIGEDQLLFRRSESGEAIEKSDYEIAGKASQAAIGVAAAMGTQVHPVSIVKVGLDGMRLDALQNTLSEVVQTLRRTEQYSHTQVMSVLFAQDLNLWNARREHFKTQLLDARQFCVASSATQAEAFDLLEEQDSLKKLHDDNGNLLFENSQLITLPDLISSRLLPSGSTHGYVVFNSLFPHTRYFDDLVLGTSKTTKQVIQKMVDASVEAGANAMMLDTSILSKISNICLVDTANSQMINFNPAYKSQGCERKGILNLEELKFFVDYCHYRGITANLAGSLDSYQAQMLWVLLPELDQLSTRGAASRVVTNPFNNQSSVDSRQSKKIYAKFVRGLAPPEHGGVLNIPKAFNEDANLKSSIKGMIKLIQAKRDEQNLPELIPYWIAPDGATTEILP
ncbi:MAG: (5-formylfuran-3-yl)methyl phosphate synthase [Undibacterium sp.]|nr:(5-formylfuran-3-yl)methyl phosphate synthase [Undibacterium sp.]